MSPIRVVRVVLDEAAFRDLVAGKIVSAGASPATPVEIILSDIGWNRMLLAIAVAIDEAKPEDAS